MTGKLEGSRFPIPRSSSFWKNHSPLGRRLPEVRIFLSRAVLRRARNTQPSAAAVKVERKRSRAMPWRLPG